MRRCPNCKSTRTMKIEVHDKHHLDCGEAVRCLEAGCGWLFQIEPMTPCVLAYARQARPVVDLAIWR